MLRYASGPAIDRPNPRWQAHVHAHAAAGLALSADRIASIGGRGDDELVWTAPDTGTASGRLALGWSPRGIAIAPDAAHVAVGGQLDDDIRAWRIGDERNPRLIEGRRSTDALAWLDDHTLVVVDGALAVWELDPTPRLRWQVGSPDDPRADVLRHLVRIEPDLLGVLRVAAGGHARIELYRAAAGQLARTIALEPTFPVADLDGALVRSPDGQLCAWAHAYGDGGIAIVELAGGRSVAQISGDGAGVGAIAWIDDARLVAGTSDGRLRLLDARAGRELGVIRAHGAGIVALATKGDDVIAAAGDGVIARWPLAAFDVGQRPVAPIRGIAALAHGLIAVEGPAIVRMDDSSTRTWTRPRPVGDVAAMVVGDDEQLALVATSWRLDNASVDQRSACTLLATDDGRVLASFELDGQVRAAAIERSGGVLVALEPNAMESAPTRPLASVHADDRTVTLHPAWGSDLVHALVVAPAPDRVCAALNDGRIVVLGNDLDVPLREWKAHRGPAVALHRIGDELVSLGLDARAVLADPRTGAMLRELAFTRHPRKREGPIAHATIDGGRALALSFRLAHVEIADLVETRIREKVELPGPALVIAAPRDGSLFAVACEGGAVRVFDARTLAPRGEWEGGGTIRQLAWVGARTLFVRNAAGQLHGVVVEHD